MNKAEHNFRLLREIEENRRFLLQIYVQNPELLKTADARIKPLLAPLPIEKSAVSTRQRGISLVELIMFIVIVSVALAGILLVMDTVTKSSADPLIHKQSLAIAESLLEEVELMPFTYCDPDDVNAVNATAATAAECTVRIESAGLDTAFAPYQAIDETRYSTTAPFDNVNDYHDCQMNTGVPNAACDSTGNGGIKDITGAVINDPAGNPIPYKAVITVVADDLGSIAQASGDALRITVTVTGPGGTPVVVEGIRTRYAPRALP